MRLLKYYITEAISTGKHVSRYYSDFPTDPTDKTGIIQWLERNGFKGLEGDGGIIISNANMDNLGMIPGEKYYVTGKFSADKMTHWIQFGTRDTMFFIRTIIQHKEYDKDNLRKYDFAKLGNRATDYDKFSPYKNTEEFAEDVENAFS